MARYLSAQWFADATADRPGAGSATDTDAVLEQVVEGTPDGTVVYRVEVAAGDARLRWPVTEGAPAPDLRISCSWPTAVAMATGQLSSEQALAQGRLRFKGSLLRVAEVSGRLVGLDPVPAPVRAATSY